MPRFSTSALVNATFSGQNPEPAHNTLA